MNTHRLPSVLVTLFASLLLLGTGHAQKADRKPAAPSPDIANEHYGSHERHVLDLY